MFRCKMKFSLILLLLAAFVVAEVVLAQTISAARKDKCYGLNSK